MGGENANLNYMTKKVNSDPPKNLGLDPVEVNSCKVEKISECNMTRNLPKAGSELQPRAFCVNTTVTTRISTIRGKKWLVVRHDQIW